MCELCVPRISRRRALGLAGAATTAVLLGRPDPAAAARAVETGYGVAVEPRATWAGDSRPLLDDPGDEDVKFLLVHHTAGPSQGDPVELIRQVYDFHTGPDKEWPDVAYNFFVEPGGRVLEGRSGSLQRAVQASATGGNQGFAQLVCLIGDFTSRNPTDAQLASLNSTLAWLADRYGLSTSPGAAVTFASRGSNKWSAGTQVTADIISGHREMSATACPGDTFFPYLKDVVQAEVNALRGNPPPTPTPTTTVPPAPAAAPPTTTAPQPVEAVTLPTSVVPETTATIPASTVRAGVVDGTVISSPDPQADEFAAESAETSPSATGRTSSDTTAWALGAGAAAVVAAAAVYVGVRGRDDPESTAQKSGLTPPPPSGGDPLR